MAQKSAKKKAKKPAKRAAEPSVMGNLRSTRPSRIGGDRRAKASKPAATKPKAKAAKPAKVRPTKRVVPQAKPGPTRVPPPEPETRPSGPPRGTEIVTTAVQAAGELAQIGATVGSQLLKRAARRIPRP